MWNLLLVVFYGEVIYKRRTSSARLKSGRRCLAMRCGRRIDGSGRSSRRCLLLVLGCRPRPRSSGQGGHRPWNGRRRRLPSRSCRRLHLYRRRVYKVKVGPKVARPWRCGGSPRFVGRGCKGRSRSIFCSTAWSCRPTPPRATLLICGSLLLCLRTRVMLLQAE